MQPAQPPMCSWCGVWTPIPETNAAVQASFRPHIARARRIYIPTQIIQYPEHVPAQERCTVEIVPSISVEACNVLAMDDLLQPTLCEVVCAAGQDEQDQALNRQLRRQWVAALRARWVDRPYPGLSWLA